LDEFASACQIFGIWNVVAWLAPLKDVIAIGGAVLGVIGTVLGVMNTMSQRWVRLVVRPASDVGMKMDRIEIVNLSSFPVTINEVGFCLTGGAVPRRFKISQPIMSDGGNWPRRLQSREMATVGFDPRDAIHAREKVCSVYARTSCGKTVQGSRRNYSRFQKELAA
jgi:hypothetical protein